MVINLIYDGDIIEAVPSFSYLAIHIDCHLKMNAHLDNCIWKASGRIYTMSKLRTYIDDKSALKLFKSMVPPYLEYGNSFLVGSNSVSRTKLQRTQNRGLKLALNRDRRCSTNILHRDAHLATWEVRARSEKL